MRRHGMARALAALAGCLLQACVGAGAPATGAPAAARSEVTVSTGTNFAVAAAPDGRGLVIDLQGTLWRLPAAGGPGRALTDPLDDSRLPDWRPDSGEIVFQSFRSGNWDLWAMSGEGGEPQQLTRHVGDDMEPAWSPTGSHIAFASDRAGNFDIWLLEVATGELLRLTSHDGGDYMPTWSPDGRRIAYVSKRQPWGPAELWQLDVASGLQTPLAALPGEPAYPSWGPAGTLTVRVTQALQLPSARGWARSVPVATDLFLVNPETGSTRPLTSASDVFPGRAQWLSEDRLLYTSDGAIASLSPVDGARVGEPVPFSVSLAVERGGYERRLPDLLLSPEARPVRGLVRPAIAPDGRRLAFAALGDLWLADTTGAGRPRRCTDDTYRDTDPAWSPDGRQLVFTSDRAGSMDLWVTEPAICGDENLRRLTAAPGAELAPAWSPDGRRIAYLTEAPALVVVDAETGAELFRYDALYSPGLPSWSSDSRHLAIAEFQRSNARFWDGRNRVLIIDTEDGDARFLDRPSGSFGVRDGDGPAWSPDGSKLAFALDGGLWVLPVSPEGEVLGPGRQVVAEAADFPAWFPDSRRLLYLAGNGLRVAAVDGAAGQATDLDLPLSYRPQVQPASSTLLRDVNLFDGTGAPARAHQDVLIEDGRIAAVAPTGTLSPGHADIIDGTGKSLLPGLIEGHTHLSAPSWGNREGELWLAYGVTTVRVTGGPVRRVLEERESIATGRRRGPRLIYTGFMFDGDRVDFPSTLAVETAAELDAELARAFALDYDFLKSYVRLPNGLQRELVVAAHDRGIPVTSHELYPAVAYGIDAIEHLYARTRRGYSSRISELGRVYEDALQLMAASGVDLFPTLQTFGAYELALATHPALLDDERFRSLVPPWIVDKADSFRAQLTDEDREGWQRVMAPRFAALTMLQAAGVDLIASSDAAASLPPGVTLVLEVAQAAEAGLGAAAAIRSATGLAAMSMNLQNSLGTVEVGKIADLVLVDGNPDIDPLTLLRTVAVFKRGVLESGDLRSLLE